MDPRLRTGLLAGGIVGALVAAVAIIAVIASAAGRGDTGKVKGLPAKEGEARDRASTETRREEARKDAGAPRTPVGKDREAELVGEVARHAWWKTQPGEARVGELADAITAMQADDALEVTPEGKEVRKPSVRDNPWGRRMMIEAGQGRSEPCNLLLFLDGRKWDRRPTRLEALRMLKGELDAADFRKPR